MHRITQFERVPPAGGLDKTLPKQGQHLTRLRPRRCRRPHPRYGKDGNDRGDREVFSHGEGPENGKRAKVGARAAAGKAAATGRLRNAPAVCCLSETAIGFP
jgi:hypothetical protein